MPERSLSRRALLRVGGLGLVGLAGCVFDDEGERSDRRTARTTPRTTRSPSPTTAATTAEPTTEKSTTEPTETETTEETTDEEPSGESADLCSAAPRIDSRGPLLVARNSRELRKCAGRPLDSFEDLSPWASIAGSMEPTPESYTGTQTMALETTGDPYLSVRRRFPEGIDLADRNLSLAVDLATPEAEQLEVRLFAPNVKNSITCERNVRSASWYRLDVGASKIRGSPDLANVTELQIRTYSGGGPLRMAVDSLRTTERAKRGAVMLTFDDNHYTQYETAFPITEEFGFPGVVGVIPHSVGKSSKIPLEAMGEMRAAGWEMVSHPQHDRSISEMGPRKARAAIRDSKRWLIENGFERGAQYLVWPYNKYDAENLGIASRHHQLGFAFGGCPVGRQVTGPLSIGRVHGDEIVRSKRLVDLAAEYSNLVILMYHTVGLDNDRIGEREFESVMAHIDRADVDVITPSDLWASLPTA
jgi:peptidoglycan/xylan/chitin deacetylase (PgdA/CDA1 family)